MHHFGRGSRSRCAGVRRTISRSISILIFGQSKGLFLNFFNLQESEQTILFVEPHINHPSHTSQCFIRSDNLSSVLKILYPSVCFTGSSLSFPPAITQSISNRRQRIGFR